MFQLEQPHARHQFIRIRASQPHILDCIQIHQPPNSLQVPTNLSPSSTLQFLVMLNFHCLRGTSDSLQLWESEWKFQRMILQPQRRTQPCATPKRSFLSVSIPDYDYRRFALDRSVGSSVAAGSAPLISHGERKNWRAPGARRSRPRGDTAAA